MAGNRDTLGEFNIKVKVDGKTQVRADIEAIRAGLKNLNDDLKKASESGKSLSDVLKSLRGIKVEGLSGGSGGSGGKSLFEQVADEAQKAADKIREMNDAVKQARTAVSGGAGSVATAFASLVGGTTRDASGNITGRTGLTDVNYRLGVFGTALNRGGTNVYATFGRIAGAETKNAAGAVIGRTGGVAVVHAFDTVAAAALKAAAELAKINGGQGGGGGNPNNPPPGQSWLERLYRGMRTKGQGFESASRMIRGLNVGNAGMINKLSSATSILGRIAGAFTGPAGIFTGLFAIGNAAYGVAKDQSDSGKRLSSEAWKRRARLSSAGLDANDVDKFARANLLAYGSITDQASAMSVYNAAYSDAVGGMERMNADLALFQTRGIEAPWMAALASQGVDYTTIKSHEDFLNKAAEMKDSLSNEQWLTFRREAGSALSESEWDLVSRGKYGLNQARDATKGMIKGPGDAEAVNGGADMSVIAMKLPSTVLAFSNTTEKAITDMQSAANKFVEDFSKMGEELSSAWIWIKKVSFADSEAFQNAKLLSDPEYGALHRELEGLKGQRETAFYNLNMYSRIPGLSSEIRTARIHEASEEIERLARKTREIEAKIQERKNAILGSVEQKNIININGNGKSNEELASEVVRQIQIHQSQMLQQAGEAFRYMQ